MNWRTSYLIITVVLTALDGVVTVYYGTAVWRAWSDDLLARGLLICFAALGATSLANVWVQAAPRRSMASEEQQTRRRQSTVTIPVELRGHRDV